jgi:transcriptional regulator with XRE-family HTH domain
MGNKLTRKELAELIGKTPSHIGTYIKRKHLVEKNKLIDINTPKNKIFVAKFLNRDLSKHYEKEERRENKTNGAVKEITQKKYKNGESEIFDPVKDLDIRLKTIRVQKEELDLKKKQAKLIEIVAAKDIMQRSIIVLSNKYRQTSKQFITEIAAKYNIPDSDLAGIQKWFDETINKSVTDARKLITKECRIVANELAGSLGVGESA